MQTNPELIGKVIYKFSKLYPKSQQVDDETIETYSEVLCNYSEAEITYALTAITRKGSSFFPSCSEIVKEITPEQDKDTMAQTMANKIWSESLSAGRYNQAQIKARLSKVELEALNSFGLFTILDSMKSEIPTLKAQLRRTCEEALSKQQLKKKNEQIKLLTQGGPQRICDTLKLLEA